jgi:hypothetical protein
MFQRPLGHRRRPAVQSKWKTMWVVLAVLLAPAAVSAQGDIRGCVTDRRGGVLPGAEVIAAGSAASQRTVTDPSGCYSFTKLPVGDYSVTAALQGFVGAKREGIMVLDGETVGPLDFALCIGALEEIDWIVPDGLEEWWKQADAVAHVRIAATSPVRSECPDNDFEHTAIVMEILKDSPRGDLGETVRFVQENWTGERTPYRTGQEMIVFLAATPSGFRRLAGPSSVFLVEGNRVVGFHSAVETEGVATAGFLARLREFRKR